MWARADGRGDQLREDDKVYWWHPPATQRVRDKLLVPCLVWVNIFGGWMVVTAWAVCHIHVNDCGTCSASLWCWSGYCLLAVSSNKPFKRNRGRWPERLFSQCRSNCSQRRHHEAAYSRARFSCRLAHECLCSMSHLLLRHNIKDIHKHLNPR